MSGSWSPVVFMLSRGCELMLVRSTLSISNTMLVTTAWSNSAGRAIWKKWGDEKRPPKPLSCLFWGISVDCHLCNLFCSSVNIPVPGVRTTSVSSGRKQSGALWGVSWPQGILGGSPGRRLASAPSVWQSCGYLPTDWRTTFIQISSQLMN